MDQPDNAIRLMGSQAANSSPAPGYPFIVGRRAHRQNTRGHRESFAVINSHTAMVARKIASRATSRCLVGGPMVSKPH
jgi:hypothetical protein